MFLDLWSLAVLTSDLLELIVNHIESGTAFVVSLPFLVFVIGFVIVCAFAWRSTYIPDLPPAPRPPYVIQITSSPTLNNNGERNSLADVRLLSSGVDVDNVLRRFPLSNGHYRAGVNRVRISETRIINNAGNTSNSPPGATNQIRSETPQATRTNIRVNQHHHGSQGQRQAQSNGVSGSSLLGLLRPSTVIQPFLQRNNSATNQAQNVIVYHRVNVYHHHHHHHHSESRPQQNITLASQSSQQIPSSDPLSGGETGGITGVDLDSSAATSFRSIATTTNESSNSTTIDPTLNSNIPFGEEVIPPINTEYSYEETTISGGATPSVNESSSVNRLSSEVEGLRLRRSVIDISRANTSGDDTTITGTETTEKPETEQEDQSTMESSNPSSSAEGVNDVRFTIKFLNDTQLEVTSQLEEKIADFKRRHFATELSENKNVRLIFNGRVLDNENGTVRDSGIFDQCVVHCLIVPRPTTTSATGNINPRATQRANGGFLRGTAEPGIFFVGFVGVFLIFLWFICFHFGQHLFTQSAVVSLSVLTGIFLIGLVAFYLPVHPTNPAQ